MKKTIPVLIALLSAFSASAVSLSWAANTSNSKLTGLTSGAALSTGSGSETAGLSVFYILYSNYETIKDLGAVSADDIDEFVVVRAAGQTSASASATGRVAGSGVTTAYTSGGNDFFARAYTTFNGEEYFMDIFAGSGEGGVWTTTMSGAENIQEKLTWVNGTYGGSTGSVGTKNAWVKVATSDIPEPATGALALAGIALLFKRRRA